MRKRAALAILILFSIGSLTAGWMFYQSLYSLRVNRLYCQERADVAKLGEQLNRWSADLSLEIIMSDLLRERVGQEVCRLIESRTNSWSSFSARFENENLEQWKKSGSSQEAPWGCQFYTACTNPQLNLATKIESRLPSQIFPGIPSGQIIDQEKLLVYQSKIQEIRNLKPKVLEQYESDKKRVCESVGVLQATKKMQTIYLKRCPHCGSKSQYKKIASLRQFQQSGLQQNIDRFKLKWTNPQSQELDCLTLVKDDIH